MKFITAITITAASLLAIAPVSADTGQGKGSGTAKQTQQTHETRSQVQQTDMRHERTRAEDRVHQEHRYMPSDNDIYGSELMSAKERDKYREQLQAQTSDAAREQFQLRHEQAMQQRARQQVRDLVPPGQGPVYGGELMTVQERNAYREQLRHIVSEEQRAKFEARHREKMDQRAMALNLDIEETE